MKRFLIIVCIGVCVRACVCVHVCVCVYVCERVREWERSCIRKTVNSEYSLIINKIVHNLSCLKCITKWNQHFITFLYLSNGKLLLIWKNLTSIPTWQSSYGFGFAISHLVRVKKIRHERPMTLFIHLSLSGQGRITYS